MGNETKAAAGLEERLAGISPAPGSRAALDSLVSDYRRLIDRKKLVDADVNYNWLWQAEITRVPRLFARATKLQNAILDLHRLRSLIGAARDSSPGQVVASAGFDSLIATTAAVVEKGLDEDVRRVDLPSFVEVQGAGVNAWRITVPMFTDIADTAFVAAFERAVEGYWRIRTDSASYEVDAQITFIDPRRLYCPDTAAPSCAAPVKGSAIDLRAHIARFPQGRAVLTSGAGTTHVTAGRAIVLSPFDVTTTLLAHEFGHLMGLRDAYLRGSFDRGPDGYVITELVVDQTDIMGNSRTGTVKAAHFERLIAVKDVAALMQEGLASLYERSDAETAIARFQAVLVRSAYHYGATVQLAKALDAADRRGEAEVQWRRVLDYAELIGDEQTARDARARLGVK
jgi:hypothetical protein